MAHADLLVDPAFEQVQGTFCHQHSHEFEVICPGHKTDGLDAASCGAPAQAACCQPASPSINKSCEVPYVQDTEENRLVYMTLFKQYQAAVESLILQRLKETVPGFSMEAFLEVSSLQGNVGNPHVAPG